MNSNTESDNNSINKNFDLSQNTINECFNDRCDNWNNQNNYSIESNYSNICPLKANEYHQNETPNLYDLENDMIIDSNFNKSTAPLTPIEKTQKSFYNLNDNANINCSMRFGDDNNSYKPNNYEINGLLIKKKKSQNKKMKNPQKEKIIYSK